MTDSNDYYYEVWRRGGDPDAVHPDEIPENFDWVWDEPKLEHLPSQVQEQSDG